MHDLESVLLIHLFLFFQIMGSKGDMEAHIDKSTNQKVAELHHNVNASKEKALARLLTLTCDIQPEVHQNLQVWATQGIMNIRMKTSLTPKKHVVKIIPEKNPHNRSHRSTC